MSQKSYAVFVAVLSLFLGAIPVLAHHSISSEFDPDKEWTVTAVLTKIDWVNPHIVTRFSVTDPKSGQAEEWMCEGNPPATLRRAGMVKTDWKLGETVSITCAAAKDGTRNWGFLKMIKYKSDGHVLVFRIGGE